MGLPGAVCVREACMAMRLPGVRLVPQDVDESSRRDRGRNWFISFLIPFEFLITYVYKVHLKVFAKRRKTLQFRRRAG